MNALKICVLQGAFFPVPPVRGGAVEKLWYGLAVEFSRQGHDVTQVSRAVPELPESSEERGVRHLRVKGYDQPASTLRLKLRDLLYTRRALKVLPDADVIVTNTFWAPLLTKPKHGLVYVSVERMPKGQMKLYRGAARLRACSQAVADGILREAPAAKNRVKVVPNPLPFTPSQEVDWTTKGEEVIYVGRIHPVKGVELLLRAFVRAKKNNWLGANWRLTFVGPSDEAKGGGGTDWWQRVLAIGGDEKVQWVGPVYDEDELNSYYRRARIIAYPTMDEKGEAMPIAPLEGMAWGCVPVVSALACFKDYVIPNDNGVVFDHESEDREDALALALTTASGREGGSMGMKAVAVRNSHGLASIAGRFLTDFNVLMKQ